MTPEQIEFQLNALDALVQFSAFGVVAVGICLGWAVYGELRRGNGGFDLATRGRE